MLRYFSLFCYSTTFIMGWDSKVVIATRYGMGGPGWNPHLSKPDLGPTQPPLQWVRTQSLSRGKAAGMRQWPPTSSRAEVKERAELYLSFSSLPSWPVLGWTSPYFYYIHLFTLPTKDQNISDRVQKASVWVTEIHVNLHDILYSGPLTYKLNLFARAGRNSSWS
jgi:hypothetical protein